MTLFLLFCCLYTHGATNIQVGLAFGTDSSFSSTQKISKALDYENALNGALTRSGIFDREFEVVAFQTQFSVNPIALTSQGVITWMTTNNQNTIFPGFGAIRNNVLGNGLGVDIVLMYASNIADRVVNATEGIYRCGAATFNENVSDSNSETVAFAVIVEHPTCLDALNDVIPHEVGHILYSEHHLGAGEDGNPNLPAKINHGIESGFGANQVRSIMHANGPTSDHRRFSGSFGFPNDVFANVKAWFQTDSMWETVAAYRQPPPQAISWNIHSFIYCHQPHCALWDMGGSGGEGASSFDIKRSLTAGGPYITVQSENSINHFTVHAADERLYWKICGINSTGETCSPVFSTRPECEVGGGPEWRISPDVSDELVIPDLASPKP